MSSKYAILEVVEVLGIQHKQITGDNFNAKCPFCNHKKYLLNCNVERDIYRCNFCGTYGGAIDLYCRVRFNKPYNKAMKQEVTSALNEELGRPSVQRRTKEAASAPAPGTNYPEIPDARLNELHQKLFSLPALALRDDDRDNLRKRGLTDEDIARNGYRSVRASTLKSLIPAAWKNNLSDKNGPWAAAKAENPVTKKMSATSFLISLAIGQSMIDPESNETPEGMAGAFEFKPSENERYWGVRLYDGILIPIRNRNGEIVAAQIRSNKENASSKYMLLSSSGMQGGRKGKTRIHHPLENLKEPRASSQEVLLTEGPLKADIYTALDRGSSCRVMALIGVQTTSTLISELKGCGTKKVYEALDMDKLLKPPVLSAEKKIKHLCLAEGMEFSNLFWDEESAADLANKYYKFAKQQGVELPPKYRSSPQLALAWYSTTMFSAKLKIPEELETWPSRSKGIDDYAYHTLPLLPRQK